MPHESLQPAIDRTRPDYPPVRAEADQWIVPRQFFLVMAETPCPYLHGRWERKLITELHGRDATALHSQLSRAGFRRSHHFAYRPACSSCAACVPVRVPCRQFLPATSQTRCLRRNADLRVTERPAKATLEQFELFNRYVSLRHSDGEMAGMSFADYQAMVEDSCLDTKLVEVRDPRGNLLAGCLVDWLNDGASAVYSFYDPEISSRSLGSFCILWLIEAARRRGLSHVYLGYWIARSPKMTYKSHFRPLEGLIDGDWQLIAEPRRR